MILLKTRLLRLTFFMAFCTSVMRGSAQQVTGVWEGKINNNKVELKLIQKGDSLTGTSYYYSTAGMYRRYSVKGYFDVQTNDVVWWDDQLITSKTGSPGKNPQLSSADFNCPGGGEMHLDGKATPKDEHGAAGSVHLTKMVAPVFSDEWDYVMANYTTGANDPDLIDSIGWIASKPSEKSNVEPFQKPVNHQPRPTPQPTVPEPEVVIRAVPSSIPPPAPTIQEKFTSRKKEMNKEILLEGDSLELRFYDNAEIDGDSISLFLNDALIFTHVRLTEKPYIIKLSVSDLKPSNELVMVAENLGAIPPNTSYMIAIVGDQRYDAYLASTENSSAMIRLRKMDHRR